jgi:glutaminyl-peptide cyclotransferase
LFSIEHLAQLIQLLRFDPQGQDFGRAIRSSSGKFPFALRPRKLSYLLSTFILPGRTLRRTKPYTVQLQCLSMDLPILRVLALSFRRHTTLALLFGAVLATPKTQSAPNLPAPTIGYTVVARYPHSTASYTEGLFFLDGLFYEGTGLEGRSALLAVRPETGKAVKKVALPPEYFGEGIVDWGPYIYEWTWTSQVCFVYDRATFRLVKQLSYGGEGWGMTRTNEQIVTSDGSANLSFRDPNTLNPVRSITVHDGLAVIEKLNELEFIKGEIYANIWHSDKIARISPADGRVIDWIDLSGLLPAHKKLNEESVLNGIAYDVQHDRLFVTGKQWPTVFQIKLLAKPREDSSHGWR